MAYQVSITADAVRDLRDIAEYIAEHDLPDRAIHVLDTIEAKVACWADEPHRGDVPREFAARGINDDRQVFFKPYRIIYRVFEQEKRGYVYLIADGLEICKPCSLGESSILNR
ncbi:MAG: type II toxin-antitoxin system RelE/ParE family toxin [Thiohalocapsa sp.]